MRRTMWSFLGLQLESTGKSLSEFPNPRDSQMEIVHAPLGVQFSVGSVDTVTSGDSAEDSRATPRAFWEINLEALDWSHLRFGI